MLAKAGGPQRPKQLEKFHLSLCKQILGAKNNTSSSKMLGELGRFSELPLKHNCSSIYREYLS